MKYIILLSILIIVNTNQRLDFDSPEKNNTKNYSIIDNKVKFFLKNRKIFNLINNDGFICYIYNSNKNKRLVSSSIIINYDKTYKAFFPINAIKNIIKNKLQKNKLFGLKDISIIINNSYNIINNFTKKC